MRLLSAQGVSGYEDDVRRAICESLPPSLAVEEDSVGNVIVRLGKGSPRVLVAAPMDEPGFVVSGITADGFLRLNRVGRTVETPLADQFVEGQRVTIGTQRGPRVGVVACWSTHLHRDTGDDKRAPFSLDDAYVDVGARTFGEAEDYGFRLLDPVTRAKQVVSLGTNGLAAPAAGDRACAAAMAEAIRRVAESRPPNEIVFAFLAQEQLGRKGIDAITTRFHADRAYLLGCGFGVHRTSARTTEETDSIPLGVGVLAHAAKSSSTLTSMLKRAKARGIPVQDAPKEVAATSSYTGGPTLPDDGRTIFLGVPCRYGGTPVECVDTRDVEALERLLVLLFEEEVV
ncbi:MAG: hypothetical protein HYR85_16705 [Planctomycetes bacterium]|nr:hypothetical protein [Planctomycetota bacterium]MBI3846006.1 hypothetical protein [Planctomycetota bacterium]